MATKKIEAKKELEDNPLKVYDNLLFISSEKGTKLPLKADFAVAIADKDGAELATAIVIQMNRHPFLVTLLQTAMTIYENQ